MNLRLDYGKTLNRQRSISLLRWPPFYFVRRANKISFVHSASMLTILVGASLLGMQGVQAESNVRTASSPFSSLGSVLDEPSLQAKKTANRSLKMETISATAGWVTWRLAAEFVVASLLCTLLLLERRKQKGLNGFRKSFFSRGDKSSASLAKAKQRLYSKRQAILKAVTADSESMFQHRLEVQHLMTPTITRVFPDTSAKKVEEIMLKERLRHVMVCDVSKKLLGVISDRDLRKNNARTAEDLMTSEPLTVSPFDLIGPAMTGMMNRHISCLPVEDEGRLCGVLTTTDLMMALQCCLQVLQAAASTDGLQPSENADEEFELAQMFEI